MHKPPTPLSVDLSGSPFLLPVSHLSRDGSDNNTEPAGLARHNFITRLKVAQYEHLAMN